MSLLRRAISRSEIKTVSQRLPFVQSFATNFNSGQLNTSIQQQLAAYGNVGWLFAVVNRIAHGVAMNEWQCFQDAEGPPVRVPDHPYAQLWDYINPFYTRHELIVATEQHFQLVGEAFWVLLTDEKTGLVKEIWPIRPDKIVIQKSPTEYISGYWYINGNEKVPLSVDDVVHFRNPDPMDDYRGRGVVQAILADVEGEQYASLWNRQFFLNSAQPGGVIEYEEMLSREEFEEITRRWKEQHQGTRNAHKVAVIEGGKWKDVRYTQRDMQFGDLRRINRDAILGAFGVPMPVLGITEAVNRANAESGEYLFAKWTVKPALQRYKDKVNDKIGRRYADNVYLDYKDPVPPDPTVNLNTAVQGYAGYLLTLNEGRKRLGENPVEGGNTLFEGTGEVTIVEPDTFYQSDKAGKGLQYMVKSASSGTKQTGFTLSIYEMLAEELADLVRYIDLSYSNNDPYADIADRILDTVGAGKRLDADIINRFNWDWETRHGVKLQRVLEEEFIKEFMDSLDPDLTQPSPVIVSALASSYSNHRMIDILSRDGQFSIVATTRRQLLDLIDKNSDASIDDIKIKLVEHNTFSPARAKMIARTELSYIRGMATYKAAILQGKQQKRWITSDESDSKECLANERIGWIDIGDKFPSGDYTTPGHPGGCGCFIETSIGDTQGVIVVDSQKLVDNDTEVLRCPVDNHRLPISGVTGTVKVFCRYCKQVVVVEG